MNLGPQTPFHDPDSSPIGYIWRGGIPESRMVPFLIFLWSLLSIFHSNYTNSPSCPPPCQHWLPFVFLVMIILTGMRCCLLVWVAVLSDNEGCGAPLPSSFGHTQVIFWEIMMRVFYHVLIWLLGFDFFAIDLWSAKWNTPDAEGQHFHSCFKIFRLIEAEDRMAFWRLAGWSNQGGTDGKVLSLSCTRRLSPREVLCSLLPGVNNAVQYGKSTWK